MVHPMGDERLLGANDIIVSKTNLQGRIIYANDTCEHFAGYSLQEMLGQPHSMIRHDFMPRCVFQFMWERLQAGHEVFAYVVNAAKDGSHYWVLAHVTPSVDSHGVTSSYHSNRRRAAPEAISKISTLYAQLLEVERAANNRKQGQAEGYALLGKLLADLGMEYDEYVLTL